MVKYFGVKFVSAGFIAVVLTLLAFERNLAWENKIVLLRDAAKKSPFKARAHHNLGVVYRESGFFEKAVEESLLALRIEPDYYLAHGNLATSYLFLNKYEEAEKEFLLALEYSGSNPAIYINVAYARIKLGKLDSAEEALLYALPYLPRSAHLRGNLGLVYLGKGLTDKAAIEFEKALEIDPDYKDARRNLVVIYTGKGFKYAKSGDYLSASAMFRRAFSVAPDNLSAIYGLALSLEEIGNKDEALGYWRLYIETAPKDDPFNDVAERHAFMLERDVNSK